MTMIQYPKEARPHDHWFTNCTDDQVFVEMVHVQKEHPDLDVWADVPRGMNQPWGRLPAHRNGASQEALIEYRYWGIYGRSVEAKDPT
jgi:hypothetical protein